MNGPSLLNNVERSFKPSIELIKKIHLAGPVCDLKEGLEQASMFSNVVQKEKQPFYLHGKKSASFVDSSEWLPSCSDSVRNTGTAALQSRY